MKSGIFTCFLLLGFCVHAFGQNNASLSGFVYDEESGEALIGVNVYIPELQRGSSTNVSGYYIIPKLPQGDYTLVCDYLGYQTYTSKLSINIGEQKVHAVRLASGIVEGEIVEVIADSIRVSRKLYEKDISKVQLSARQISQIPQVAEADLLRSLQTLPGILPVSDYSSALHVRGGSSDQNLYLLDGTDVYNPEHAFGLFSTFNTDAIKHVEISKGGFNAAYGGRLSSILDVNNLDGNRERFEGKAAISLLSAKTTLQMPLGSSGAISASIRRTYFDQTIGRAIDDIPDYYFYDGNIKAFWELNPQNKITVSLYGGRDDLSLNFNNKSTDKAGLNLDWGNSTASIRWTRVFSPQLFANFWLTGSRFSSTFDLGDLLAADERNKVTDITAKGNLEYHHSSKWLLKFGFEQKEIRTSYKQNFPGGKVDVENRPRHSVAYLQNNWRPTAAWDIELGLRYSSFQSKKNFQDLAPRFSAKYRLSETINLKAAAGIYYQYLHRIPQTFTSDIWTTSNAYQDQSRASHLIFGFQKEVANDYQLEIEGYYKDYGNLYRFNPTFITELEPGGFQDNGDPIYTNTKGIFNQGDGYSQGVELLLRKDVGAVTGWIGYSYSDTKYQFDAINDGLEFAPRHDRSSTVNLVATIDLKNAWRSLNGNLMQADKRRWTFGINFVYGSGQPITLPGSAYLAGDAPGAPEQGINYFPSQFNGYRLPYYSRLDLSINYRREFKSFTMEPYLQVFNIGNRKNVWFVQYDFTDQKSDIDTINMFPILPTFGVNFTF